MIYSMKNVIHDFKNLTLSNQDYFVLVLSLIKEEKIPILYF